MNVITEELRLKSRQNVALNYIKNQIIEAYDEIRHKCPSFRYICIMKTRKERKRRETV